MRLWQVLGYILVYLLDIGRLTVKLFCRYRIYQDGRDSANMCFFANELPVAGWFVLQRDKKRFTQWRVWVISHWGKSWNSWFPPSCHLLHADNIDASSSRGRSRCPPDNEEGAVRNRNERERKRGQDDSDRWRRVWPFLISNLTSCNRCEPCSWTKGPPVDHPPDGSKEANSGVSF